MCAGLPVVAAREVGCVPVLVKPGENGATFEAKNVAGLAHALAPILTTSALRASMSRRSVEIIAKWGFAECAAGLRAAVADLPAGRRRT